MAMKDLIIGLGSFLAGAVLCRLYYAKAITIGRGVLAHVYGDYKAALAVLRSKF